MESMIVETAIQQGLWAALFVALFLWTLKDHAKREEGYKDIIRELTEKFGKLDESVKRIAAKLEGRKEV